MATKLLKLSLSRQQAEGTSLDEMADALERDLKAELQALDESRKAGWQVLGHHEIDVPGMRYALYVMWRREPDVQVTQTRPDEETQELLPVKAE